MDVAVRTTGTTGEVWAIVIVAVVVTAILALSPWVASSWQNRYHRRLRDAGMWDSATAPVTGPGPTVDAPGIVSTAAGRMGPEGQEIADTLPARAAVAPMEETAAGMAQVPGPRSGAPVPAEELAAQAEAPTRPDLPAQRDVREDEQAQPAVSRPGAANADDRDRA